MTQTRKRSVFAQTILNERYYWTKGDGTKETHYEMAYRVASNVLGAVGASKELIGEVTEIIATEKFWPGGRYLSNAGLPFHQCNNCGLLRVKDTRDDWGETARKAIMMLTTGAGIGVVYSDLREEGAFLKRIRGVASGPIPFMKGINELGRVAKSGGHRRGAIWAGLHWNHPDIEKFLTLKNWPEDIVAAKRKDWNFPAPMDHTNISVIFDDLWMFNSNPTVFNQTLYQACKTGDPGFSFDFGVNNKENLRNACTELTSEDPDDICNLGSINLANIESLDEMKHVTELATLFLLAGTVYSDLPYKEVEAVRTKNRRLGLGLMGIHEFLIKRGERYGSTESITPYLKVYQNTSRIAASYWAGAWEISTPVKTCAIAPNGTIGIAAETTMSAEPLFCVSYKRLYLSNGNRNLQYVVDPVAKRLVAEGVDPNTIEDAYSLATDVERRIAFQAYIQQYVDHAIASTVNLPAWGSEHNNLDTLPKMAKIIHKYCDKLRGLTFYPDGARDGQPLTAVSYEEALRHEGEIITESGNVCDLRGGSCGA